VPGPAVGAGIFYVLTWAAGFAAVYTDTCRSAFISC
jgi:hypothetical protein